MDIKNFIARKNIVFILLILIIFLPILLLLMLIDARWTGGAVLALSVFTLCMLRKTKFWKGINILFCWLLVTILSLFGLVFSRPDMQVSFTGTLIRESIGFVMQLPYLKGDKMLKVGSQYAGSTTEWKAPEGYLLEKHVVGGIPIELLQKNDDFSSNVILQFHGGAYVIGLIDIYRDIAVRYAQISDAAVLSVDYRIAPEYSYPAALEDALIAWEWLLSQGYSEDRIIVVGDSAGGNLALAMVAKLRDEGRALPKAVVCMSPWADLAAQGDSYITKRHLDPMFGTPNGKEDNLEEDPGLFASYAQGVSEYDKYLSPVYGEFNDFPPMLIQVGTYEVLESDSLTVYKKAAMQGVDVRLTRYEGMFHVFQLFGNIIPESRLAWTQVEEFLHEHFE